MKPYQVESEARDFADRLSGLLNATVCNGPRISAARLSSGYVVVGRHVSRTSITADPVPIAGCAIEGIPLHLILSFTLAPDDYDQHLMVVSSVLGLCLDPGGKRDLFHADYERDKRAYPEAHLQVSAWSDDWAKLLLRHRDDPLKKLHLPAGGRRYRTTVEDIIEFLFRERLVVERPGWESVVSASRDEFDERQLRAAVRAMPMIAADELSKIRSHGD